MSSIKDKHIPPWIYDSHYLLESMEGAEEFNLFKGEKISGRQNFAMEIGEILPGYKVLDIGCGRGELTYQCAKRNAHANGLDYSPAAVRIAQELRAQAIDLGLTMDLEQASALALPFKSASFDVVFMLDIVEHLYPDELFTALREVKRLLKSGGKLVLHTMPNADYYRWIYPIYRVAMRIFGKNLPVDPRTRWYRGETHVNIQNPSRLKATLKQAGFLQFEVWLQPLRTKNSLQMLLSLTPARRFVINDIFGIAVKE